MKEGAQVNSGKLAVVKIRLFANYPGIATHLPCAPG
jgi:hypothetical protein